MPDLMASIQHPSGQIRWNTWTLRALFDPAGSLFECQGVGRDITEKRKAIERANEYIRGMEFLSQTSMALMDTGESDDLYDYVVRQVHSLAPVPLVWLGITDGDARNFVLKSLLGDPVLLEIIRELPGGGVTGKLYPMSLISTIEPIPYRSFAKIPLNSWPLNMQVPKEIWGQIKEATGGLDIYLMGLVSKGRLIGDVGICQRHGSPLPNKDLLETFIRKAAIAIDRRIANASLTVSLAREREQVQNLLFLSRTAMDLVEMDDSTDIYRYIADRLYELIPESLIGIYSYDPEQMRFTLRATAGEKERIDELCRALGIQDPLDFSFPICELARSEEVFCQSAFFEVPSLCEGLFHQIPGERCAQVDKEVNLCRGFCMGFTCRGKIFGGVTIGLFQPGEITNQEIVEAFLNQASVALLRRRARERHRESEELFQLLVEQMPYPTILFGRDGQILDANRLAATLFGCPGVADLIKKPLYDYIECGASYPPGQIWHSETSEDGELSCQMRLRSSIDRTHDVEAWGRKVQYNWKPALCLVLRPLYPENGGGSVLPHLSGGSAGF